MVINQLYKKYFQKSKILLYPLLGFARGSYAPLEVYLGINGMFSILDRKLICVYDPTSSEDFLDFKEKKLIKHRLLEKTFVDGNGHEIFVFDFSAYSIAWDMLVKGKYSQIPIKEKNNILNFFEKNSGNYIYLHSYLFPNKWHQRYAEILDVPIDLIKEVNELLDVPDLERENLHLENEEVQKPIYNQKYITIAQPCTRCNGAGYFPEYKHISNGKCFKCGGAKTFNELIAA